MLAWDSNRSICQYLAVLVNIQISWAIFGHQDSRPLSRQLPIAVKAVFSCMHSSVNEIYLLVEKWSQQTFLCRKEKYVDCTRFFTYTGMNKTTMRTYKLYMHTAIKVILPQAALRWCQPLWEPEPLKAGQPVSLGSGEELWWESYGIEIWNGMANKVSTWFVATLFFASPLKTITVSVRARGAAT